MVELERVDLCVEVSMIPSHLALPRKGHLEQLYHIFAYLKKHHNADMPFDPTKPEMINEPQFEFEKQDWSSSMYGKVEEELPSSTSKPLGRGIYMRT